MANELTHGSVGTELTQAEWEAVGAHVFNSQAAGDILYASTTAQLTRLAKGADNTVLHLASGIPAWSATLAGLTLTTPTISSTGFTNATHAHAASNSGGTISAGALSGTTLASSVVTTSATTVGALASGTIASGFGTINNGSSTITTTGLISGGDLTISGSSTTVGTVTSGVWNAGAVTSSGAVTGASLVADLTTLDANTLSTSSGNLAIRAAAGADVLIGDDATILYIDGGAASGGTVQFDADGASADTTGNRFVSVKGAFTAGTSAAIGLDVAPSLTSVGTNAQQVGINLQPAFNGVGSQTHSRFVALEIEPSATMGSATVTDTAGIKVTALTEGVNDYALWVAAGKSRFGGDIDYYGALTNASDERVKSNIRTISSALSKVSQMRGVSFDRLDNQKSSVGVIAQEMELIAPEVVSSGLGEVVINEDEEDQDGHTLAETITNMKGVNYSALTAYFIEAIKELKAEIDILKAS